ncbi:MAG: recombinase family protein [Deltaproteobacteria bacterium]
MAKINRVREVVKSLPDPVYLTQRMEAGWKLVALEWERVEETEGKQSRPLREEVPYGMRVSDDCLHLEENPEELQVLMLMMEEIVQDNPLSKVVTALNAAGFRTREGEPWDAVAVFNMLPRLIEVGPRMFSTEEWELRRRRLFKMV